MPRVRPRLLITGPDGQPLDITPQVQRLAFERSASIAADRLRVVPSGRGRLTLSNGDKRWTPGQSQLYETSYLGAPIAFRIVMGDQDWVRGRLDFRGGRPGRDDVEAELRAGVARLGTEPVEVQTFNFVNGVRQTLADTLAAIRTAIGVQFNVVGLSAAQSGFVNGGPHFTKTPAQWIRTVGDMLPSVAYQNGPDSTLTFRLIPSAESVALDRTIDSSEVWIEDAFDATPDGRRIVNVYRLQAAAVDEESTVPLASSIAVWGTRQVVSEFDLWTFSRAEWPPPPAWWNAGLALFGSAPVVVTMPIPLTQPTEEALAIATADMAGEVIRVTGGYVDRALMFGEELVMGRRRIPMIVRRGFELPAPAAVQTFRVGRARDNTSVVGGPDVVGRGV